MTYHPETGYSDVPPIDLKPTATRVSIFREGAPTEVVELAEWLAGHAEAIVRLYEAGDEDVSFEEITCPDFEHHEPGFGCTTCRKPAL